MTKKVVVKVSINAGDKRRSPCKRILIELAKLMAPWEFLWKNLTPTAAQNRTMALRVAVSLPGVQEAGLEGEEKNQLVVKGDDDFDPVKLTEKLRRKVAFTEIVSVAPEKKEEKKEEKQEEKQNDPPLTYPYASHPVPPLLLEISEPRPFCGFW